MWRVCCVVTKIGRVATAINDVKVMEAMFEVAKRESRERNEARSVHVYTKPITQKKGKGEIRREEGQIFARPGDTPPDSHIIAATRQPGVEHASSRPSTRTHPLSTRFTTAIGTPCGCRARREAGPDGHVDRAQAHLRPLSQGTMCTHRRRYRSSCLRRRAARGGYAGCRSWHMLSGLWALALR